MSRDKARLRDDWDDQQRRRRYEDVTRGSRRSSHPQHHPPGRRRVWPWLLIGCASGIGILVLAAAIIVFVTIRGATGGSSILPVIGNPGTYTRQSPAQSVGISELTAIRVHNPIGDVTISVDANATAPTVAYTKKVRAANNDDANNQFNNIAVQVQPTGTPDNTLAVSASVPDSDSLLGNHNASVELNITVPAQRTSSTAESTTATPVPLTLTVDMSIGNVTSDGLSGILQVKDNIGNITVRRGTLSDGTRLQTGTGNVTFDGNIDTTPAANNTTARYKLQSETGNVDATLPADTNLTLDANTNAGTITSDFPIKVQSSSGSATFYGPLNPGATSGTTLAVLSLNVSTGNVMLHRA
ncbi:MAG: hypothetical protein ACJ788_28885 [Ktedonobacteraceae bacterium]